MNNNTHNLQNNRQEKRDGQREGKRWIEEKEGWAKRKRGIFTEGKRGLFRVKRGMGRGKERERQQESEKELQQKLYFRYKWS